MTDVMNTGSGKGDEFLLLHTIERFNLIMLCLLTAGSWYFTGRQAALSVLIGGALSCGSFFLLKRNAVQIVNAFSTDGEPEQIAHQAKLRGFAGKFYARLAVFGILLGMLSMSVSIDIAGLVLGLSTVMLSVILVVLFRGRTIFQENM